MADRLATLQTWVEESPDDAFSRYALAMEFRKHGQLDDAAREFGELIKRNPNYCATYYHYALLLAHLSRKDEAKAVIQRGLEETTRAGEKHAHEELQEALVQIDEA
jgi:tetratricopeptide (TPR) repeat protein